jgi:hypothetical protein
VTVAKASGIPAYIGREVRDVYNGRTNQKVGVKMGDRLELNFGLKRHTFIVAKSGSGKSYLARVLAEELIRNAKNYAVIMIDPMGIFSTLDVPNEGDEIEDWNKSLGYVEIDPKRMENYQIWIPAGDRDEFEPGMYDREFSLLANQISEETLIFVFDDLNLLSPQVNLYRKAKKNLTKENSNYTLTELNEHIRENGEELYHFRSPTVEALCTKLDALAELGLITNEGIELSQMVIPGQICVFDLSASQEYTARIIINFFAEQLYKHRKRIARKDKHARRIGQRQEIDNYIPSCNLVIDEAHKYLPRSKKLQALIKTGRNTGSVVTAISQSPDLTSELYSNITHLFVGHMVYSDEIGKVKAMLPVEKNLKQFRQQVRHLKPGFFYYYNIDQKSESLIQVRPSYTLHLASTELHDELEFLIPTNFDTDRPPLPLRKMPATNKVSDWYHAPESYPPPTKRLPFSHFWYKLNYGLFCTIRLDKGTGYYKRGEIYEVVLGGVQDPKEILFDAQLVGIQRIKLRQISEGLARFDCEHSKSEAIGIFEKMYGRNEQFRGYSTTMLVLFFIKLGGKHHTVLK